MSILFAVKILGRQASSSLLGIYEGIRTAAHTVPNQGTAHAVQCKSSPVSDAHRSDTSAL